MSFKRRLCTLLTCLLVLPPLTAMTGKGVLAVHAASLGGPPTGQFAPAGQTSGEVVSMRTQTSRTSLKDGRYVTQIFQSPINYKDSGTWQPIDDSLVASSAAGFAHENKANSYHVRLPASLSAGPVRVETAAGWISFSLTGGSGPGSVSADTDTFPITGGSVAYTAQSQSVKEAVTLSSASAPATFTYTLKTSPGLSARASSSGGIDVLGSKGTVQFSLAAPMMSDAAGAVSRAVTLSLSADTLTLSASATWLHDPARRYPVVIDPSVYFAGASQDCTISPKYGSANVCALPYDNVGQLVGSAFRTLLQFNLPQAIPTSANVVNAQVALWEYGAASQSQVLGLYGVTHSWTNQATWATYDGSNAWATAGGDINTNAYYGLSAGPFSGLPTEVDFYLATLAQGWLNHSIPNNGVMIRAGDESQNQELYFYSSNPNSQYAPSLTIGWYPDLGAQPWQTFVHGVNVADGNMMLASTDIAMPSVGIPLSVGRVYNSLTSSYSDFGSHWLMTTGADVGLQIAADGSAAYYGPGGIVEVFGIKADGSFLSPPGADATLVKNGDGTYTLTSHASGFKLNFSTGGYLVSEVTTTGNTETLGYTGGKLVSLADTIGQVTLFAYNSPVSPALISSITDPAGRVYSYTYDAASNLTSFTRPDGRSEQYTYDQYGDLTSITDFNGNLAEKISYTCCRQPASITDVLNPSAGTGPTTSFTYTGANTTVTDPNNHSSTYTFDFVGRVPQITDPLNHTTTVTFNNNNDVTKVTPPSGNATIYTYSGESLTGITLPTGAQIIMSYADVNWPYFPTSVIDAQGNTSSVTYNPTTGTVATSTATNNQSQSYTYNSNGTLASVTDANNHTTSYSYINGLLQTETRPSPLGALSWTYNALRLPATSTDGKGQVTTYTYDHSSNLTQSLGETVAMAYQNADHTAAGSTGFSFDFNGNNLGMTDATGSTTYSYDNLNRLTSELLPTGQTVTCTGTSTVASNCYTYDGASNLLTKQDSQGTTTYGYYADDSLSSVKDRLGATTTFSYSVDGQLTNESFPNGASQAMTYNTAGQLTNIQADRPGGVWLLSYTYNYTNPANNQPAAIPYSVTDTAGNVTSYSYDSNNALTGATQKNSGGTQLASYGYGYDSVGNLTSENVNGNSTTLTYNAANELTQATGAINDTYSYDGNGDLVSRSDGLVITQNAQDQLTSMTPPGGSAINMIYTGLGEGRRTGAGSNKYQYDATGMSLQTGGSNTANFTTLPDGSLLSETVSSSTYYFASDGAGNVAGLIGPSGLTVNTYQYDPMGNITSQVGGAYNPFTFQGWMYDSSTGFYYTGSGGYYDPTVGLQTGQEDTGNCDPGEDMGSPGEDEPDPTLSGPGKDCAPPGTDAGGGPNSGDVGGSSKQPVADFVPNFAVVSDAAASTHGSSSPRLKTAAPSVHAASGTRSSGCKGFLGKVGCITRAAAGAVVAAGKRIAHCMTHDFWKSFIAGAVGGAVVGVETGPFDIGVAVDAGTAAGLGTCAAEVIP